MAAHFFLKIDAFSGWTNGKRNVICDALHSCLPPNDKMPDFPPAHHPWWRPGSHDIKPPCILKFYSWKLCALLSRPPISILLALCSTLPSNVPKFSLILHWYKYINISATNFCRTRCAPAIQTEHSLTNTCPWPQHFQTHCAQELPLTTWTMANSGYCLYFPIFNFDNLPISCPSKQNICKNNLCD